jgi:thiol-disulfide isomerase/thioredoxin
MTKPYKNENFLNTIWDFLPGIIKIFSIISAVIIFFTSLSLLLGSSNINSYEYNEKLIRTENYSTGNKDSKVKFIYFFDLQCPACKAFNPTFNELKNEYQDKIEFAYKNNPLEIHTYAVEAARGAAAAQKQGKFAEFVDLVYARQDQLGANTMENIATEIGLNIEKWQVDKKSSEVESIIEFDQEDLKRSFFPESSFTTQTKPAGQGAGTPTIAIMNNGEVIDWFTGGQDIEQIKSVLETELAK